MKKQRKIGGMLHLAGRFSQIIKSVKKDPDPYIRLGRFAVSAVKEGANRVKMKEGKKTYGNRKAVPGDPPGRGTGR